MRKQSLASKLAWWWIYLPCGSTVTHSKPWARLWAHFWERTFTRVSMAWSRGIMPHLTPRRFAKAEYDFWVTWRLPEHVEGYVWGADAIGGWIGVFRHADGPTAGSQLCCFCGDTEQECKDSILEHIAWCEENAGKHGKSWEIRWFNSEPPEFS